MFFASLWRDGLWARSGDGTCGLYLERVDKESFKTGPVPSDRVALRLFLVDLNAKSGDAQSICNKMWPVFITILKVINCSIDTLDRHEEPYGMFLDLWDKRGRSREKE